MPSINAVCSICTKEVKVGVFHVLAGRFICGACWQNHEIDDALTTFVDSLINAFNYGRRQGIEVTVAASQSLPEANRA